MTSWLHQQQQDNSYSTLWREALACDHHGGGGGGGVGDGSVGDGDKLWNGYIIISRSRTLVIPHWREALTRGQRKKGDQAITLSMDNPFAIYDDDGGDGVCGDVDNTQRIYLFFFQKPM